MSMPLNSRVIEWGNKPIHCKTDLPLVSKPTAHTWIRVSDPSCPVKMTKKQLRKAYVGFRREFPPSPLRLYHCRLCSAA